MINVERKVDFSEFNCKDYQAALKALIRDVFVDGWTDGNAHRGGLSPGETKLRIEEDWENSWSKLILEDT